MSQATHGQGYPVAHLVGPDLAIVLVAGGEDGYVGRDGPAVGDNPRGGPPGAG
jgi:hypothetical protein